MPPSSAATTISVRLPEELHRKSREAAKRRNLSLNALVQESLAAVIQAEEERLFYESFTLLGQDAEMCAVEYALLAQREVMLRSGLGADGPASRSRGSIRPSG